MEDTGQICRARREAHKGLATGTELTTAFPQWNPNTGGKPATTIAAQTEYAGR